MEKPTPHRKLPLVEAFIASGKVQATGSAYEGALSLGVLGLAGICEVVLALDPADFFKSMTTHADHRI